MPIAEHQLHMYSQYYEGCYVYIQPKDLTTEPILVFVGGVSGDETEAKLHTYASADQRKALIVSSEEYNVLPTQPKGGFVNLDVGISVYAVRRPSRQWSRGYNKHVWKLHNIHKGEGAAINLRRAKASTITITWDEVHNIFNPHFFTPQEAVDNAMSLQRLGSAINDRFSVVVKAGVIAPVLYYKTYMVGWFDKDGVVHIPQSVKCLTDDISQYWSYEYVNSNI